MPQNITESTTDDQVFWLSLDTDTLLELLTDSEREQLFDLLRRMESYRNN